MKCDCIGQAWEDVERGGMWFQHGDNPEARAFISNLDFARRKRDFCYRFLRRWEYRIHARIAPMPKGDQDGRIGVWFC